MDDVERAALVAMVRTNAEHARGILDRAVVRGRALRRREKRKIDRLLGAANDASDELRRAEEAEALGHTIVDVDGLEIVKQPRIYIDDAGRLVVTEGEFRATRELPEGVTLGELVEAWAISEANRRLNA